MMCELEYTPIMSNSEDLNWGCFQCGNIFNSPLQVPWTVLTEEVKSLFKRWKAFCWVPVTLDSFLFPMLSQAQRFRTKSTAHKDRQLLNSGVKSSSVGKMKLSLNNDCRPKKVRTTGVQQTIKHTSSVFWIENNTKRKEEQQWMCFPQKLKR